MTISSSSDLLKLFIKNTSPIFFDVGANLGQSSLSFRTLFPYCIIHLFEPDMNCVSDLRSLFSDDKSFINNLAISDKNEMRQFNINSFSQTNSFYNLNQRGFYSFKSITTCQSIDVLCTSIDSYIEAESVDHIDFMKIDTQGHSYPVLSGSKKSLAAGLIDIIQVEIIASPLYDVVDNVAAIFTLLSEYNYCFYSIANTDSEQLGNLNFDYSNGRVLFFDAFFVRSALIS